MIEETKKAFICLAFLLLFIAQNSKLSTASINGIERNVFFFLSSFIEFPTSFFVLLKHLNTWFHKRR